MIVIYFNYDDSHFSFQYKFQGRFVLETAFISGSSCIVQDLSLTIFQQGIQ